MSRYENYDQTSATYDQNRAPIGVEILAGCFAMSGKRLDEMVVLDAGCGTGAYSQEMLRFVGRIHAVDLSAGMLAVAAAKLEALGKERIAFHRADLLDLPFEAETFDGIMVNQVLHHLDTPGSGAYPNHEAVIGSLARKLKPGGVLVINTCSREQVVKGFWTAALVPDAAARISERYMPLGEVERALRASGLTCRGRFVPVDAVIGDASYFDARGPLRKEWRDGDSLWALTTPAELSAALSRITDLDQKGELEDFVARLDAERPNVGQITFVCAVR